MNENLEMLWRVCSLEPIVDRSTNENVETSSTKSGSYNRQHFVGYSAPLLNYTVHEQTERTE